VDGDRTLLVTALSKPAGTNAIAYSPAETPRSRSARRRVEDVVEVAVTDRGQSAIAPEHQVRGVRAVLPRRPGRAPAPPAAPGLGLAIVKHVAANHGGEVKLWSHPGTGVHLHPAAARATAWTSSPAAAPAVPPAVPAANAVPSGVPNGVNNGAQLGAHGAARHLAADLAAGRVPEPRPASPNQEACCDQGADRRGPRSPSPTHWRFLLRKEGFTAAVGRDRPGTRWRSSTANGADIVLLDLMLPGQ